MKLRIALLAAVVIVLLGALATLFVSRFDPADAAEAVREHVRERYGRELTLDGQMSLTLWPVLSISIPGARLSEVGSDRQAASFERANVEIAWLPLARGRMIVEKLWISRLHARIEEHPDGTRNIDNLIAPLSATPDAAPGDEPAARAPRVEIGRVELSEASLEYEHTGTGRRVWLDDIDLRLDELAARMVTPIALRARMVSAPEGPSAFVRLTGILDIDPVRRTLGVRGVEASLRGFMSGQPIDANARARRFSVTVGRPGLVGRLESFAISLKGANSRLQIDAAHARGTSLEYDGTRLSLAATGVEANAKGRIGGEPFEASITLPEVTIANPSNRGRPIELVARLRGTHEVDLKLSLDGLSGGVQNFSASRLALAADATIGALEASLRLNAAVRADLDTVSVNLGQISGTLTLDPGSERTAQKLPLVGSVHGELAGQTIDAEFETRVASSLLQARARFDATPAAAVPLALTLNADQIDIDRMAAWWSPIAAAIAAPPSPLATSASGNERAASSSLVGPWSRIGAALGLAAGVKADRTGIDSTLTRLTQHDWIADLRVAQLKAGALRAAGLSASLRALRPGLGLRGLSLSMHGGTVSGHGDWHTASGDFTVSLLGRGIEVGPLLDSISGSRRLEGTSDWRAELGGRSGSAPLAERLYGQLSLRVADGRLHGLDLSQAVREHSKRLRPRRSVQERRNDDSEPAAVRGAGITEFTRFAANLAIGGGQAHSHDLLLETPHLRATGSGTIDLDRERIDSNLRIGIHAAVGDPLLAALSRLTLPLRVHGSLREPEWSLGATTPVHEPRRRNP